jgi:hypothetical protein
MAWWQIAGQIVAAAGGAYLDHLRRREEEERRERDRREILNAIRRVGNEILTELTEQRLTELRGELEGFRLTYGAYDPDPADRNEENRLVRLIDDSARVIGQVGQAVAGVANNQRLALDAWPIYLSLIYLRAQAMTERQVTYGSAEAQDALPAFDAAIPRLDNLLAFLRRQSDARFGPVVCRRHPDFQRTVCWYQWGRTQEICGSLSDPTGIAKCQRARARHMESAYQSFEGVAEITAAAAQLQEARDALDTVGALDWLAGVGVNLWGEVVVAAGRFHLPASFPSDRAEGLFRSAKMNDTICQ